MQKDFSIKQNKFILMICGIEGFLLVIALIWGWYFKINPLRIIYFKYSHLFFALFAGLTLCTVNFFVINVLADFIGFFRNLKEVYAEMTEIAANITIPGALFIAVASGITEEIFFRGIIQPQFGIVVASIVFGLFHMGGKKVIYYSLYTMLIGLYLGWLLVFTGNLLVTVIVHVLNNFIALPYMRYYYHKYVK